MTEVSESLFARSCHRLARWRCEARYSWRVLKLGKVRLAARCFYWGVLRCYDSEICNECGRPVGQVWHAEEDLYVRVIGNSGGQFCVRCFDAKALAAGESPWWEVAADHFPTCDGRPCSHEKPMMIQAESAREYWEALVFVTGSREAAITAIEHAKDEVPA